MNQLAPPDLTVTGRGRSTRQLSSASRQRCTATQPARPVTPSLHKEGYRLADTFAYVSNAYFWVSLNSMRRLRRKALSS
jgi:hypothetical protein